VAAILFIFFIALAVNVSEDAPPPVPPQEAGQIILKRR
jgi:hypothetical protein